MKVGEATQHISNALKGIYDESESINIAQLVLEEVTGQSRSFLLLNKSADLTTEQQKTLDQLIERLQKHEPLQYTLNKAWFYGMELYVDKAVLIPRPETEELVDWVIRDIKELGIDVFERGPVQADVTRQLKILDIGTGSGCIALALKKRMPRAEVWGCDISEEALNVARRNGAALDIRVDFQGINFLDEDQQTLLPSVDVIVSNPPYVPLRDKENMQRNVVDYEPHTALFVPNDDALLFYKAIVQFAKKRLYDDGAIYFEIHEELGDEVAHLLKSEGYSPVEVRKDLQGKPRMVKAKRQPAAS